MTLVKNVHSISKLCIQTGTIKSYAGIYTCRLLSVSASLKQQNDPDYDPRIQPPALNPVATMPRGWKHFEKSTQHKDRTNKFSMEKVEEILKNMESQSLIDWNSDMPVENMPNPYQEKQRKCIICQYNIHLDYKNSRLLSQFICSQTGKMYDRDITGLCLPMHKHVYKMIARSRAFGFLPYIFKKDEFLDDPNIKLR